jgi:effector-binding domain-containing protein
MKKLKNFLIGLLIVALALLIVAFFLPRQVHVERSGTIEAPPKVVFNQVNNLHTWEKWAVWNQIDPEMKVEFENTGVGEGAAYTWESEDSNVGSGRLTITASEPYDSIATEMDFMEKGTSSGYFLFEEVEKGTKVTWGFDTDLGNNPAARWMGLMFDSMLGKDFEKGIENLGVVSETIVQEGRPIVEIVTVPEFNYVSMRSNIQFENTSTQMGVMYGKLSNFIDNNDLMMTDTPYAIYHKIDGTMIDLECGIPVEYKTETNGDIISGVMPTKKYATADHFGSHETLGETHQFIQNWIVENGFELVGSPMEKYLTDPQKEPDVSKWVTAIYYPVK